ncbi:hypothetical protein F444_01827, partial [Phytophthora nicotianae P1976]
MSDGSSQPTGGAASDVEAIHDAGVSKRTRVKYKSSLNGIKRWIVKELSKEDANTGRSMSVQTLQTQHLLAKDDSVGVVLVKTKTNQEGSGPRDPRDLYANPLSPSRWFCQKLRHPL